MKIVATESDYQDMFGQSDTPKPDNLKTILDAANLIINNAIKFRIAQLGSRYDTSLDDVVKKAICYQANTWIISDSFNKDDNITSYSFGNISVSKQNPTTTGTLCTMAYNLLSSSGLLYKGVI